MSVVPPRLTYLRIRNYRALRDVEFRDLTPLTVLIGANGSGKSTVLDALGFWSESAGGHFREAWRRRGGFDGMHSTQSAYDHIELSVSLISVSYEESINEVAHLHLGQSDHSRINGLDADADIFIDDEHTPAVIDKLFRHFRHIHFTDSHAAGFPDSIPEAHLSPSGDNLPNVLFYLKKKHPELLAELLTELRRRVPRLESITAEETIDKRLVLRLKDEAFAEPIPARFASDGTLRLLAYLVLLNEPEPAGLLGVEEPEAEIHPSLHGRLAEDFIEASTRTQIFVATHSPQFLDALEPEQVWVLDRTPDGYTRATRAADIYGVQQRIDNGSSLGALWLEGRLDPDTPQPPTR